MTWITAADEIDRQSTTLLDLLRHCWLYAIININPILLRRRIRCWVGKSDNSRDRRASPVLRSYSLCQSWDVGYMQLIQT